MIKILVDTLGGDNSPSANVEGAVKALSSIEDLEVVLVGDEKVISEQLKNFTFDASRLSIVHAPD